MVVGVVKEPTFESRVSLLAEAVSSLIRKNIKVFVEDNTGALSFSNNENYIKAGFEIN